MSETLTRESESSGGSSVSDQLRAQLEERRVDAEVSNYQQQNTADGLRFEADAAQVKADRANLEVDITNALLSIIDGGEISAELSESLQARGINSLDKASLLAELSKDAQDGSTEIDSKYGENTVRDSELNLAAARTKLVEAEQNPRGRVFNRAERQASIEAAQAEYMNAFTDNLLDILNIDPKDALASGYLPQVIEKISLHQNGEAQLTEQDLLGTYGHIVVDAVAREQYYRQQALLDQKDRNPQGITDKIRNNKVFRGAVIAGSVAIGAVSLAKDHLPESVRPVAETISTALPFLGGYISSRGTLDALSSRAIDRKSKKADEARLETIAGDTQRAGDVLTTVYGSVEGGAAARQASPQAEVTKERLEAVQTDLAGNLRENAPNHPMYEASVVIEAADRLIAEHGTEFIKGLETNPADAVTAIASILLQQKIAEQRTAAKQEGRITRVNRVAAAALGLVGGRFVNELRDARENTQRASQLAGIQAPL